MKPFASKSQTPKTKQKNWNRNQESEKKPRSIAFERFSKETVYKLKKRGPRPFGKTYLCSKTPPEHDGTQRCTASSDHRKFREKQELLSLENKKKRKKKSKKSRKNGSFKDLKMVCFCLLGYACWPRSGSKVRANDPQSVQPFRLLTCLAAIGSVYSFIHRPICWPIWTCWPRLTADCWPLLITVDLLTRSYQLSDLITLINFCFDPLFSYF